MAAAEGEETPVNLLVLRPTAECLSQCSREGGVRCWNTAAAPGDVAHPICERILQCSDTVLCQYTARVHVVVHSGRTATVNQSGSVIAYIRNVNAHVAAQLALEGKRPVLIPGHGVGPWVNPNRIATISHIGC